MWNCYHPGNTHSWFLFSRPIFPELTQIRPVSNSKHLGIVVAELLKVDFLSVSVKAVKAS